MTIDYHSQKNKSNKRSTLLIKNVIASFIIKGWSALVILLMVPLTLKILDIYNNGVWLTLSSILIWIDLMDIGLGNGLRNAVANYVATGDHEKVREAVSSTFFMLIIIVFPFLLITYSVIWGFDMYGALGIDPEKTNDLNRILYIAVTIASSTFILKAVGNFYMGLQLPAINNLIVCIGQTSALLFTFMAYLAGSHSLLLVVVINTAAPFITWAVSIPYTFKKKYPQYCPSLRLINFHLAKSLCSTGIQFFVIQICGVILFTTTNIIISKVFSPEEVTPYQVAYRYFHIAFVLFSIICMPFWNATTDAYAKGDIKWIQMTGKKLNILICVIAILLIIQVILSNFIYEMWVGKGVYIPKELSICVAVYILILTISQRYSYILNGLNVLKIQLIFTITATIIFIPLALLICNQYGTVTSLVCVMCLINTPGMIANMWKYYQIINIKNKT